MPIRQILMRAPDQRIIERILILQGRYLLMCLTLSRRCVAVVGHVGSWEFDWAWRAR